MMQKSTTFTTIFCVKKCHFHYDTQKNMYQNYMHLLTQIYSRKLFDILDTFCLLTLNY
jgi:hypothetical protein